MISKSVKIILVVLLGLICIGQISNRANPTKSQVTPAVPVRAAPAPQKLSPLEECANLQLIIDRSLSVQQAFGICEMPPEQQFETWLATRSSNRSNDPTYRAVRDGVRDALRR